MKKILLLLSLTVFLIEPVFAQWKCPVPVRRSATKKSSGSRRAVRRKPLSAEARRVLAMRNDIIRKARQFGLVTQFTVVDGDPIWVIGQPINPNDEKHNIDRDTRLTDYAEQKYQLYGQIDADFIQKCNGKTYWFFTYVYDQF